MIDTVTNLNELMRVPNATSRAAAEAFEAGWLMRYPRPIWSIHDQGTEFIGEDFQALLQQWGIRGTLIGVQNPHANAFCEQMHQPLVGNILQTTFHANLHRTKPMRAQWWTMPYN
jgi:transposase InsO family protein